MLRWSQDEDHCVRRSEVIFRTPMIIISQESLIFLLSSGSFSALLFVTCSPISEGKLPLHFSHKLIFFCLYISLSIFFSLSDIACFCFLHFLNFSYEAELVELGRKPFKYVWKCNRETILTRENLALNSVRSSPKKQEMGYKSQVLSGGWIPRIPPINVCPRDSEMLVESWSNGVVLF